MSDVDQTDVHRPVPGPWSRRAACLPSALGVSPREAVELMHPVDAEGVAEARSVCAACPVRDECRAHAIRHAEPHGVWGGLGERARNLEIRRRHVA